MTAILSAFTGAATQVVFPTGDTSGVKDAAVINAALGRLPATGGVVTLSATGLWYINCGAITITKSGVWIDATGCYINAIGAGDMIRMYDSSNLPARSVNSGGLIGFPTIDGTSTTGNACAFHAGDINQLWCFAQVQNFTAGTTSKGVWFDNQYFWTEQINARIFAAKCRTGVMFDNSTGTGLSASATGSFDRFTGDIFLNSQGAGDGCVLNNGAFIFDGKFRLWGNMGWGTVQYATLKLTGSNAGGGSHLSYSQLLIAVELDGSGTFAPYTIQMSSSPFTNIDTCTGYIDFSSGNFTAAPVNSGNFKFSGPVTGDGSLQSLLNLFTFGKSSTPTNGATMFHQFCGHLFANPAGAVTGVILQAGAFAGHRIVVLNTGAGTITFAASGTSNVADGVSDVIAVNTAAAYIWNDGNNLWYRCV